MSQHRSVKWWPSCVEMKCPAHPVCAAERRGIILHIPYARRSENETSRTSHMRGVPSVRESWS
jgi:hypothetical protein